MRRRLFLLAACYLAVQPAYAGLLDSISSTDAGQALRDSLAQGAKVALARLGKQDGFFANPTVKIGLPKNFKTADKVLRALGQGKQVDALVLASNRAAEAAAAKAEPIFIAAVKQMTLADAKAILAGGEGAATAYFRKSTETALSAEFKPLVASVTDQSGLAQAYNAMAATLVKYGGFVKQDKLSTVEDYVTRKALDGIYASIAEEEKAIRADPARYAGSLIGKVFGALK
jgi:hypothetical protein